MKEIKHGEQLKNLPAVGEEVRIICGDGTSYDVIRRWEALSPDLRDRALKIRPKIQDVHPMSEMEWINGFLYDLDPASEVAVWEKLAERYQSLSAGKSRPNRKQVWASLIRRQKVDIINPDN